MIRQADVDVRPCDVTGNCRRRLRADRHPGRAVIADLKRKVDAHAAPFDAHRVDHGRAGEVHRVAGGSDHRRTAEKLKRAVVEVQHLDRADRKRHQELVFVHRQNELFDAPAWRFNVRQFGKHEIERIESI